MKAFVFAAGIGSRLKPFTDYHPKALAPVCGMPILQHILLKLRKAGVNDVVVNLHHFSQQIIDFLQSNSNFGMHITFSDESDLLLDTGGAVAKAIPLLSDNTNEPVMLHNADILTDFPIGEMLDFHNKSKADVTLLVNKRKSSRQLYFTGNDNLAGWQNLKTKECKPQDFRLSSELNEVAFGGVHIIQPTIFNAIVNYKQKTGNIFSIIPFYLENITRLNIKGYTPSVKFMWHDIGTTEKLAAANREMELPKDSSREADNSSAF